MSFWPALLCMENAAHLKKFKSSGECNNIGNVAQLTCTNLATCQLLCSSISSTAVLVIARERQHSRPRTAQQGRHAAQMYHPKSNLYGSRCGQCHM